LPGIAVVMPYDGVSTAIHTYGVDVLNGSEIGVYVDEIYLQSDCWEATYNNGDSELYDLSKLKVEKLLGLIHNRSQSHEIGRIVEQELGPPDGRPITKEDIGKISGRIAEFMVRQIIQGNK
jgi:hypothetical protein